METAIVSIICIALIVFGGMTLANGFMTSVDASTAGLQEIGQRNETIVRTELLPVSSSTPAANTIEVIMGNAGQTRLSDYTKWDIIVQYFDETAAYQVKWLPQASGALADNQWEVGWIRLNGMAEVFEPNVLNPGEQIMLRAQLNPAVGPGTTNMFVIATPGGITSSTYFTR